jgi:hypothetical protein
MDIRSKGKYWYSILPPFVEGGRDPPIPPTPELIHAHGSHDFNAWQPSHCPMLFPHLAEFKVSGRGGGGGRVIA